MTDTDPTTGWSAEDTSAGQETPVETSPATDEGEETGARGTRRERRAGRDQTTRDETVRTERDEQRARADQLAAQVDQMRSTELLRHAEAHLSVPADLMLATTAEERAAVWKDDGTLDEGLLSALLDGVITKHPNWGKEAAARRAGGSMDMGFRKTGSSSGSVTWADIVKSG